VVETVKIARFQNRRGLKQDLPKPLRPGEIGFTTDSRQVYIGADTTDATAQTFNKTSVFEQTVGAQATTESFANVQIIKFTVPHKFYNKGELDGVTNTLSWLPTDNVSLVDTNKVFDSNVITYTNAITGLTFQPQDIFVVKNGTTAVAANSSVIPTGQDYYFTAGTTAVTSHSLKLRTSPAGSDEIGIAYYGNSAVLHAISNATIGITGVTGFYSAQSIPTHRQLSNSYIRVTPDTGVGFIGLQFKHIAVASDVLNAPTAATFSGLGNLLLSRNDDAVDTLAMTANATNIIIVGVTPDSYNVTGTYASVLVENSTGGGWINDKVLTVSEYDTGNATIVADIPSFNASTLTGVSAAAISGGNIDVTVGSSDDILVGDILYFIDSGVNESNLNAKTAIVTNVVATAPAVITMLDPGANPSGLANVSGNVSFITYSAGSNVNVLIRSTRHGAEVGDIVTFNNSDINTGDATVLQSSGANTFVVASNVVIIAYDPALTFTPVIANGNVSATPVITAGLSSAASLGDVTTTVNGLLDWPSLNLIPDSSTMLYLTHSEAFQKTGLEFKIHNDTNVTASLLGLTPGEYTRNNSTVKSKLETWLNTVRNHANVNIFTDIFSNQQFNDAQYFPDIWDLGINSVLSEMSFNSRTESRDFTTILNKLYYESVNPNVKGLLNIKTNIEFLTLESLASGSATTSYNAPNTLIIPAGYSTISALGANVAAEYDTFVIEYSLRDSLTPANNYSRVGTILWIGNNDANEVALTDSYSDILSNVTGNIIISASISGSIVTINADNTLVPSNDVTMRYIVRRWNSSP